MPSSRLISRYALIMSLTAWVAGTASGSGRGTDTDLATSIVRFHGRVVVSTSTIDQSNTSDSTNSVVVGNPSTASSLARLRRVFSAASSDGDGPETDIARVDESRAIVTRTYP